MKKLVWGKGFNDRTRPCWVDGKIVKEYVLWQDMLRRCFSEKCQTRQPSETQNAQLVSESKSTNGKYTIRVEQFTRYKTNIQMLVIVLTQHLLAQQMQQTVPVLLQQAKLVQLMPKTLLSK